MKSAMWAKLNKKMTAEELFGAIPRKNIEIVSLVLLCFMATLPLLAAIVPMLATVLPIWFKSLSEPAQKIVIHRYALMNTAFRGIGYLGLLLGGFVSVWNRYNRAESDGRLEAQALRKAAKSSVREKFEDNGPAVFLGAMLTWSIFSTIFSTDPVLSLFGDTFRRDGLLTYFGYAGVFMLARNLKNHKYQKIVLEVFAGIAALLALVDLLDISTLNIYCYMSRYMSIFINRNHYGYYLCMAAMAGAFLLEADGGKRLNQLLHIAEFSLICSGLIRCKTLGTLLATLVALTALLVFIIFVDKRRLGRTVLICLLALAVFAVSSIGVWDLGIELYQGGADLSTIGKIISGEQVEADQINNIGSVRGILWINAVKFIGERPLFGYGPENLATRYSEVGAVNDRPHNELLQFGASLGIPAMLMYILAMISYLMLFIRNFKRVNVEILCAYCVVLAYLVSSMFGNTMFYTSPFFFMSLGFGYALIKEINDSDAQKTTSLPSACRLNAK